jgi:hypothetical protein
MIGVSRALKAWVDQCFDRAAITPFDVRILATLVLPEGILNRAQADVLLALHHGIEEAGQPDALCATWYSWLEAHLKDFVVWSTRPTGIVEAETGQWLQTTLSRSGDCLSPGLLAIGLAIVQEAERVEEHFLSFVMHQTRLQQAHTPRHTKTVSHAVETLETDANFMIFHRVAA